MKHRFNNFAVGFFVGLCTFGTMIGIASCGAPNMSFASGTTIIESKMSNGDIYYTYAGVGISCVAHGK